MDGKPTLSVGSVEFDLLRTAVRPRPDLARVGQLLEAGIDSDLLVVLAAQHGVRSNLLRCLSTLSWVSTPPVLRETLERFERYHLARTLSVSNELVTVATALSAAGIPFATFKGPILALQLYGDLALREYADVDLIVPEADMARAEKLLAAMGYRNIQGDRPFREAFLRHQRQYALVRDDLDAAIDLHWGFTADPLPFPLRPSEIWSRLAFVSLGGCSVPTLAKEDVALLLAGHGTKEGWRSLSWVCDFAMLVERVPDLDWARIHARARGNRSGDAVLIGCAMAHALFETPIPSALAGAVAGSPRARTLAAAFVARLRSAPPDDIARETLEDALLCDLARDRLWARVKLSLTPTPGDYHALPLPAAFWPLYRLMRPVRLGMAVAARVLRRSRNSGHFA